MYLLYQLQNMQEFCREIIAENSRRIYSHQIVADLFLLKLKLLKNQTPSV